MTLLFFFQGFGFLTFENKYDAERAKMRLNGATVGGRKIEVIYYNFVFQLVAVFIYMTSNLFIEIYVFFPSWSTGKWRYSEKLHCPQIGQNQVKWLPSLYGRLPQAFSFYV